MPVCQFGVRSSEFGFGTHNRATPNSELSNSELRTRSAQAAAASSAALRVAGKRRLLTAVHGRERSLSGNFGVQAHPAHPVLDVGRIVSLAVGLAGVPASKHGFELAPEIEVIVAGEFRQQLDREAVVAAGVDEIAHAAAASEDVVSHDLRESPGGRKLAQDLIPQGGDLFALAGREGAG